MSEPSLLGHVVGGFAIERLLGSGGMGDVYAVRASDGRRAALKVLNHRAFADPGMVERFHNEARAVAALRHAGIVELLGFERLADGRPCMLLELLEGRSLADYLDAQARLLTLAEVSDLLDQICAAVSAAHAIGVVHRDLKPDNLFVVETASGPVIKLLDFGIAKIFTTDGRSVAATRAGTVMGSPEFMSPEQLAGETALIGTASDVYAIGVIAYALLTGAVPFPWEEGQAFAPFVRRVRTEPAPSLVSLRPDLPASVDRVVAKALAKAGQDRWPTAAAFADAFALAIDPAEAALLDKLLAGTHLTVHAPRGIVPPPAPPPASAPAPAPAPVPAAFQAPITLPARAETAGIDRRRRRGAKLIVALIAAALVALAAAVWAVR